ncbi:hypothetical protein B0T25DRAFT_151123 [Lasiosphaeria hispida]|uniref:Uncharacterized protein n=1 Tax=Lasiosphaeria hispida TaxID=260671 RepID=A0AAJ0MFZ9_9PEZI|nr:hypothetical protein B0T25DRAFT_151123 [Lasiosphaeria hispida]
MQRTIGKGRSLRLRGPSRASASSSQWNRDGHDSVHFPICQRARLQRSGIGSGLMTYVGACCSTHTPPPIPHPSVDAIHSCPPQPTAPPVCLLPLPTCIHFTGDGFTPRDSPRHLFPYFFLPYRSIRLPKRLAVWCGLIHPVESALGAVQILFFPNIAPLRSGQRRRISSRHTGTKAHSSCFRLFNQVQSRRLWLLTGSVVSVWHPCGMADVAKPVCLPGSSQAFKCGVEVGRHLGNSILWHLVRRDHL